MINMGASMIAKLKNKGHISNAKILKHHLVLTLTCIILLCTLYFVRSFHSISDKDYIKDNYSIISLKNEQDVSDLNILDNDIKGKEIFLTGEGHANSANYKLKMKFLKYFKEKTDFKYLLCEYSYSEACYLNEYLKSGNIKILADVFKPVKGTFDWNIDEYNFWKELYNFNKGLPMDKRIQVVGIDIEFQLNTTYRYINSILPKKREPESIYSSIESFRNIYDKANKGTSISNDEITQCFIKIQKDLHVNQNIYKRYLGNYFFQFQYIVNNITKKQQSSKIDNPNNETEFFKLREKYMYDNFNILYNKLPKGKYYGQFGVDHVLQHKSTLTESFAARISNINSNLKGKVYSIGYVYEECQVTNPENDYQYPPMSINYTFSSDSDAFKPYLNNNVTLFRLNERNSPFRKKLIWPYNGAGIEPTDGVLTDYLQSIVVIKGFRASQPLNDRYNSKK
jgi:erythromycin esterase-like protein